MTTPTPSRYAYDDARIAALRQTRDIGLRIRILAMSDAAVAQLCPDRTALAAALRAIPRHQPPPHTITEAAHRIEATAAALRDHLPAATRAQWAANLQSAAQASRAAAIPDQFAATLYRTTRNDPSSRAPHDR